MILSTIHNASDVPHRLDIAGLLTRADRTLKPVAECGFESRFHQYFLPDMRPQLVAYLLQGLPKVPGWHCGENYLGAGSATWNDLQFSS